MNMGFFFDSSEEKERKRELREEAREYREEAQDYLADAKDNLSDYRDYKESARDRAKDLEELMSSYNQQKVAILKELGGEISSTIENFRHFNISSHVPKAPSISSAPSIPSFTVSSFTSNMIGGNFNPLNISLQSFSDLEKNRSEARRQRNRAENYAARTAEVNYQMKSVSDALYASINYVRDERNCVNELMGKLRELMNQLNAAMNQDTHTEESARQMEGICKIAEQIKGTHENQIVDNSGAVQENYRLYSQRIREINSSIPSAPKISESSGWLDLVLKY